MAFALSTGCFLFSLFGGDEFIIQGCNFHPFVTFLSSFLSLRPPGATAALPSPAASSLADLGPRGQRLALPSGAYGQAQASAAIQGKQASVSLVGAVVADSAAFPSHVRGPQV